MIHITMIAAQSLDGFISRHQETGTGFCSEQDAAFLSESLQSFDSMIMGRKTYETLRTRITNSKKTQYLRKIRTNDPNCYADDHRENLVEFTNASPADICYELVNRGRTHCALLGGGETYTEFLKANLVDELWLTIEPCFFGSGTPLATGTLDKRFRLISSKQLSADTILLKYAK